MNYILRGWFQGQRALWCRASGGPYVAGGLSDPRGQTKPESRCMIRRITEDCCGCATPSLRTLEALYRRSGRRASPLFALVLGRGTFCSSAGSQVGPHRTTRLAIRHHSATWLSLALIQLTGTGTSRLFSLLPEKHSQPELNSEDTAPLVPTLARRSPRTRCSMRLTAFSTGVRRSIFRRSMDDGWTIQTSQTFPLASRNVR
jgi:hypothetical protein